MSSNNFDHNSDYLVDLIESARQEVHDFWSDINTPELNRLLKQLQDFESQHEKLFSDYQERLHNGVYDDPLGIIAQKEYQIEQQKLLDADLYELKSEKLEEIIYRSKYHKHNFKDGVLNPIEIERLYSNGNERTDIYNKSNYKKFKNDILYNK